MRPLSARLSALLALSVTLIVAGCAGRRERTPEYTRFYEHQPRSILVVPVLNESTEVSAGPVFATTISVPLAERGYYVFPVYLTDRLLDDMGLTDAGLIHQVPVQKLGGEFGADAVLMIIIKDWSTKYVVISSSVVVSMEYSLYDTGTGELLWHRTRRVSHDSDSGGFGIAGAIVDAAINALVTDYRPLARQANRGVLMRPGVGLPAGKYHSSYGQDRGFFY